MDHLNRTRKLFRKSAAAANNGASGLDMWRCPQFNPIWLHYYGTWCCCCSCSCRCVRAVMFQLICSVPFTTNRFTHLFMFIMRTRLNAARDCNCIKYPRISSVLLYNDLSNCPSQWSDIYVCICMANQGKLCSNTPLRGHLTVEANLKAVF